MASAFPHNPSESLTLARMRTLLALERNYLAEERTRLAEFRTGLALSLVGPPSGLALLSTMLQYEASLWMQAIIYGFLALATGWGIYMAIQSQRKLKRLRKDRSLVQAKEQEILDGSPEIRDLLLDCISSEMVCEQDRKALN